MLKNHWFLLQNEVILIVPAAQTIIKHMVSEPYVAETIVFVTFGAPVSDRRQVAEPPCALHLHTLLTTIRTLIAYAIREKSIQILTQISKCSSDLGSSEA